MVGTKVQQYTFLEKLGAGGMGDIYRAQDTRLNRFVAIKVLTGSSSGDPERRRRFIQEAQSASALNHPNIITIHDIITEGDAQYMVMEHVMGKTLADLIPKGGLRVPQVLKLAMQMTDALQTAHAAGIIHRDLKPGNIMVTDTGLVKVLDFGLAKLADPTPVTRNDDATKTMGPAPLTVEGSIIGTVSYMSPEQAQGKKVDTRSDVFSLGVVMYEMITGTRAFQADTTVGTLSAILRDDVRPIGEIAPDVPPKLEQVVTRSLLKVPDDRFQTMKDMHLALGALKHESDSGVLYRSMVMSPSEIQIPAAKPPSSKGKVAPAPVTGKSKTPMIVGGAVVAAAVIGGILWTQMGQAPKETATAPVTPAVEPVVATPPVQQDQTLTNDGIIDMVKAKMPIDVIYSQLRTAPNKFNLSAAEVIRLTGQGVPLSVIEGMRDPKSIPSSAVAAPATAKSAPKGATTTPPTTATLPPPPATPNPVVPPPAAVADVVIPRPVPTPAPAQTKQVVLPDGSPFAIALAADVPDNAKEGVQLRFIVVNDVRVGDAVVIAKGAVATGQISQGKGRLVGKMQLRLLTVAGVDGKVAKIRALSSRSNKDQQRPVETGTKPQNDKSAADAGTQYIAYVDGDMTVAVKSR
ncbi:MAG: serine/threonine-protein kinase [Bryobacteraceae bacterium]